MRTLDHSTYQMDCLGGGSQELVFAKVDENAMVIAPGVTNEEVFRVLIDRINSQRNVAEGALSLTHLLTALEWMIKNTKKVRELRERRRG